MNTSTSRFALLLVLLFTRSLESASHRRSLQDAPVTGIGFKPPVRRSSLSSPPPSSRLDVSDPGAELATATNLYSTSEAGDTDVVSTASSPSSASEDTHLETNSSLSGISESSSEDSLSETTSSTYFIEPISTNVSSAVSEDSGAANSPAATNVSAVQQELIASLEMDEQVTVLGEVQLGELLCDSLAAAEDAPLLQFELSVNETILANQTSYATISGETFTGGVGRRVWTGIVIDPEPAADEAMPRGVSMIWGEVCDVQIFSLEITKHIMGGNTSVVKSVPCGLSGVEICLVEVALDFLPGGEPLMVPSNSERRRLSSADKAAARPGAGRRRHQAPHVPGVFGTFAGQPPPDSLPYDFHLRRPPPASSDVRHRKLQQSTSVEIQTAVFYSDLVLDLMSVSAVQMESMISAAYVAVNEGFTNSEIGIKMSIVYQGSLPYEEGYSDTATKLNYLRNNSEVNGIRDEYGADIVLLVGQLIDVCGMAYFLPETGASHSEWAYATAQPNCFSQLVIAHEFGHNLGCDHNREHSTSNMEYAHGYRYCSGTMYTTIMSYTDGCSTTRANYFANPDVSYLGRPTGTETENCARAINENKESLSNFREQVIDTDDDEQEGYGDEDEGFWQRAGTYVLFVPIGILCCVLKRHMGSRDIGEYCGRSSENVGVQG